MHIGPTDSGARPRAVLAYSPALDGLRAVAVSAILLYHGGVALLPGGFLGVDLFFVLSGFLITSLLLLEWESRGTIRLVEFWGRRARRLLPALLAMLGAVVVLGVLWGEEAAKAVRSDGLAALFYVSNWWFVAQGNTYADQFDSPSPLQHTWSLAIEEQWYLLLPLALLLLLPLIGGRRRLGWILAGAAAASALWMALIAPPPGGDPARAYFGTDTRVQALLVGGALACIAPYFAGRRVTTPVAAGGALAGLAALTLVGYRTDWMYRGGYLLVALAFAAVLAEVVSRPHGLFARALSIAPLLWIGRISYGLYLWHWPIYLALSPERTGLSGAPLLAVRLGVTFAVSVASYHLLEMPIRRGALSRLPRPRRIGVVVAAPAVAAMALIAAPLLSAPSTQRPLAVLAADAAAQTDQGAAPGVPVVLLGDSQALALQTQLDPADAPGLDVRLVTEFGCGLIPYDSAIGDEKVVVEDKCHDWTPAAIEGKVREAGGRIGVMMAGTWEQYDRWRPEAPLRYTDPEWSADLEAEYRRRLEILGRSTDSVALILNHCHGAPDMGLPLQITFQAGRYPDVVNDPRRIAAVNDAARAAAAEVDFPVKIIDLNPLLCADGYTEKLDGVQLRSDGLHFTVEGAAIVWRYLAPILTGMAATG